MAALCLLALAAALALLADAATGAASTPTSPWPLKSHDSAQTNAAAPSALAIKAINISVSADETILPLIPAAGIYFIGGEIDENFLVYNRSSQKTSAVNLTSTVEMLGFDPLAARRLYVNFLGQASFGAYSLASNSMLWNVTYPYTYIAGVYLDSFSDCLDVWFYQEPVCGNGCLARYIGSTGKLLWTVQSDGVVLATIPASGALITQQGLSIGSPLVALDAATGKQLWTTPYFPDQLLGLAMACDDQLVISMYPYAQPSNFSLSSFNGTTGAMLWNVTLPHAPLCELIQLAAIRSATPTFSLIAAVVCDSSVTILAIDSSDGAVQQQVTLADPSERGVVSLATVGNVVYFTLGTSVIAYDVVSGGVVTLFTGANNVQRLCVDSDGSLLVSFDLSSPITLLVPNKDA